MLRTIWHQGHKVNKVIRYFHKISLSFHVEFLLIYVEQIFLHFPKSKLHNQLCHIFCILIFRFLSIITLFLSISYSNTAFQSPPLSPIAQQFLSVPHMKDRNIYSHSILLFAFLWSGSFSPHPLFESFSVSLLFLNSNFIFLSGMSNS